MAAPDEEPFDLVGAVTNALRDLYREEVDRPLEPLRDDEPAPRLAPIEQP
ncbi:hypothetical protein [Sphingomonas sp.]|nr:hypothetical protein [Sphingomonas sp.]